MSQKGRFSQGRHARQERAPKDRSDLGNCSQCAAKCVANVTNIEQRLMLLHLAEQHANDCLRFQELAD